MRPARDESDAARTSPGGAELARSFYLLEESWPVIGETGYFRPYATTSELRARLESKLPHHESLGRLLNDFLLGESVNVWTVQRGRLTAGLDVTEFVNAELPSGLTTTVFELNRHREDFSAKRRVDRPPTDEKARLFLDWDGIIARLPTLEVPYASPDDTDLTVRLGGSHPAPDMRSYINDLIDMLVEEPRPEWAGSLDYGSPYTI